MRSRCALSELVCLVYFSWKCRRVGHLPEDCTVQTGRQINGQTFLKMTITCEHKCELTHRLMEISLSWVTTTEVRILFVDDTGINFFQSNHYICNLS